MLYLVKLLYAWILPPGLFILILLTMYWFGKRTNKNIGLLLVSILIYLISIPAVSDHLAKTLEDTYPRPSMNELRSAGAIVMLGGGTCGGVPDFDGEGQVSADGANRVLMVLRLHKWLHLPVILSGGQVFAYAGTEADIACRLLKACGMDEKFILKEAKSRNTVENARFIRQLCIERDIRKVILVTSAYHMPRSILVFAREGMEAVPYPTDYKTDLRFEPDVFAFTPSADALRKTAVSMKEYLGILAVRIGVQ